MLRLLLRMAEYPQFPSQTTVAFIKNVVDRSNVPFMYSSGNHDWHYEGLPGSSEALRTEWREKSLLPLYGGRNPSHWYEDTPCGLRFIGIDNSTYQVSDAQLEFFLEHVNNPAPVVLLVHIPLFLPELQAALYSGRGSHRNGNTLLTPCR